MIADAHAQAAGSSIGGFDFMSLLPLILIFGVFYLFLIRPQQKKAQQQRDLLSSLRRGDRILTNGGIIGIITKVINDQELQLEIAEGVRVRVARSMVADLLSKTEPAPVNDEETRPSEQKKFKAKTQLKSTATAKKKISK
ncbi:MAG: preprotein translocase subunit YajC [Alphaproteobacteria bacterium 41-28]|nr:MAG: preprotein translocase subunit YajC [Alphaproteobacteria bacterium 41-28]